jgi:hypothetical protein
MQRIISEPQNAPCNSPAEPLPATATDRAQEIVSSPSPGELFFETGIVLAIALGAAIIGDFIAGIA